MKRLLRPFLFLFLFVNGTIAFTQIQKCYSVEYFKNIQFTNPELYARMVEAQQNQPSVLAKTTDQVYKIPVVVHIIYNKEYENIDDVEVFEQINILNADYRRLNSDTILTPLAFQNIAVDCNIEFCLAQFDPDGNPTTGIERKLNDSIEEWLLPIAERVKYTNQGGLDAWPATSYLNIWVINLQDGILGYATGPAAGTPSDGDGIVVDYKNFGHGDVSSKPYDLGRTATHEIGHWLGLNHIWGDDGGNCMGSDLIDDTPNQADHTYGCPDAEVYDMCNTETPGIMYQDYMDYTDDACMNLFTNGQKNKMRSVIETYRASLLFSEAGCNEIPPIPGDRAELIIYPVPTNGQFTIVIKNFKALQETMEIRIYNTLGQIMAGANPTSENTVAQYFDLQNLPIGCYFVTVFNGTYFLSQQFLVY